MGVGGEIFLLGYPPTAREALFPAGGWGTYFLLKHSITFTRAFSRTLGGGWFSWQEAIRTEEGG